MSRSTTLMGMTVPTATMCATLALWVATNKILPRAEKFAAALKAELEGAVMNVWKKLIEEMKES